MINIFMPATAFTSITDILPPIMAQVATSTGLDPSAINISTWTKIPNFQALQDVVIHVGPPVPEHRTYGVGRFYLQIRRILTFRCRSQLALDIDTYDNSRLIDPTYGLFVLEEAVVNGLQDFQPVDADNNVLLIDPMHMWTGANEVRRDPKDDEWAESFVAFDVFYALNVTNRTPPASLNP